MSIETLLHEYNPWWEKDYTFPKMIEREHEKHNHWLSG